MDEVYIKILRDRIAIHEHEIQKLKDELAQASAGRDDNDDSAKPPKQNENPEIVRTPWPLSSEEYKRYGRQLILPNIGIEGDLECLCAHLGGVP